MHMLEKLEKRKTRKTGYEHKKGVLPRAQKSADHNKIMYYIAVRARTVACRGFYVVIHFSGTVSTGRFQNIKTEPIDVRVIYCTNF